MTVQSRIKLGVTLYSLQDEVVWGRLTLQDCLAKLQKMCAEIQGVGQLTRHLKMERGYIQV